MESIFRRRSNHQLMREGNTSNISVQVIVVKTTPTHQALYDLRSQESDGILIDLKTETGHSIPIVWDMIEYTETEIRFYAIKLKYSRNVYSNLVFNNSHTFIRAIKHEFGSSDKYVMSLTDDSSELHLWDDLILTIQPLVPKLTDLDLTDGETIIRSLSKYLDTLGENLTHYLNETLSS